MAYDDQDYDDDYDNYPVCSACWGRYTAAEPAVLVWVGPSSSDLIYVHERCKAWTLRHPTPPES